VEKIRLRTPLMQTEQLLCWSGVTDTEHSTTSSSNEEEDPHCRKIIKITNWKRWRNHLVPCMREDCSLNPGQTSIIQRSKRFAAATST